MSRDGVETVDEWNDDPSIVNQQYRQKTLCRVDSAEYSDDSSNSTSSDHHGQRRRPQRLRQPTGGEGEGAEWIGDGSVDLVGSYLTEETLAEIPGPADTGISLDAKEIYSELHDINEQLKCEFRLMHEKGGMLREREANLVAKEASLQKVIKKDVTVRVALLEKKHEREIASLDAQLKEKIRENKRHKDGFTSLKQTNDALRKQMNDLKEQHDKLEKQSASLQSRLVNLQRKKNFERDNEKRSSENLKKPPSEESRVTNKVVAGVNKQKMSPEIEDLLTVIFEWLADLHLRPAMVSLPEKPLCSETKEKCLKVFPTVVDILHSLPTGHEMTLPILKYVYWSLDHLEQGPLGGSLVSTSLRRLGEEMYTPARMTFTFVEGDDTKAKVVKRTKEGAYIRSRQLPVRVISTLVLLRTVSQVDHLASAFEVLRDDVESESGKQLFMYYKATPVVLSHIKACCKPLTNAAVDVYLQMCLESPYLQAFLNSCSGVDWFLAVSTVWRVTGIEENLLEKLAILLQKLSKIRSNKKHFEMFSITPSAQNVLRLINDDTSFLSANLKSIIYNLNSGAPKSENASINKSASMP